MHFNLVLEESLIYTIIERNGYYNFLVTPTDINPLILTTIY